MRSILLIILIFQSHFLLSQGFNIHSFQEGKALIVNAVPTIDSQIGFSGMGFCVKHDSNYFLITNRHIVEKNDYYTNISHNQATSNYVKITNLKYIRCTIKTVQIRNDSKELFYGNVYKSEPTDIIAINIGLITLNTEIESIDLNQNYNPKIDDEIFIISILKTRGGIGTFTMFSRIISDPSKDYNSNFGILPIVLLEKPSLSGMSGSPVFAWPDKNKSPIFIGILSGNDKTGFYWRKDILIDLLHSIKN